MPPTAPLEKKKRSAALAAALDDPSHTGDTLAVDHAGGERSVVGRMGASPPQPSPAHHAEGDGLGSQPKAVRFMGSGTPASQEDDTFVKTFEKCTPKIDASKRVEFRKAENRRPVIGTVASQTSTVHRPDFDDALRRVSAVVQRHIDVCEKRRARAMRVAPDTLETGDFRESSVQVFGEQNFVSPQYKMKFVRLPLARPGAVYAMQKVEQSYARPSAADIYSFLATLFHKAHLSSECSIICLIYVERLMEKGHVPLLAQTWRPVCLCGLLLASKVWQDYASWNIEFSEVYPQFSLEAINRLERLFVQTIQWDMYIKQSLYAQYYFALRSLTEQRSFRQRYNSTVNPQAPHMQQIEKRTEAIKRDVLALLSKSV